MKILRILTVGAFCAAASVAVSAPVADTAFADLTIGKKYDVARVWRGANSFENPDRGRPLSLGGTSYLNGVRSRGKIGQFWRKATPTTGGYSDYFVAFCLEHDKSGSTGLNYTMAALGNDKKHDDIRRLWNGAYSFVAGNRTAAAAFQLALWEIVHETSSSYNLRAGDFKVGRGSFASARMTAQSWLNSLNEWSSVNAGLRRLKTDSAQDLLVYGVAPVPLPAGFGLLAVGLGALGVAARRARV